MTHRVFLAMGSNIGDRFQHLSLARERLKTFAQVVKSSSIYVTEPWGVSDQPDFYNAVLALDTELEPYAVLDRLHEVEQELGRERVLVNGPRTIDLDILFYDDLVMQLDPALIIPHPRCHERDFVLLPLLEIEPNKVHPVLGEKLADLVGNVSTESCRGEIIDWNE